MEIVIMIVLDGNQLLRGIQVQYVGVSIFFFIENPLRNMSESRSEYKPVPGADSEGSEDCLSISQMLK